MACIVVLPAPPMERRHRTRDEAGTMKIKILLVDDDREIVELVESHFRSLGYAVRSVTDPSTALAMVKRENFQIVISDIHMPEKNGADLLAQIKRYNGAIKVFMITGHEVQDDILACMRRGAETCLFKPLNDLQPLQNAVNEAVGKIEKWQEILKRGKNQQESAATL